MVVLAVAVIILPVVREVVGLIVGGHLVLVGPTPAGARGGVGPSPPEFVVEVVIMTVGVILHEGVSDVGAVVLISALAEVVDIAVPIGRLMADCVVGVVEVRLLKSSHGGVGGRFVLAFGVVVSECLLLDGG